MVVRTRCAPPPLAASSVLGHRLLELAVRHTKTTLKVWLNDPIEPDEVCIAVGEV